MASRKSVLDDGTTVLLRSCAGLISGDRRYRAPTLDREPIAQILSAAHQFEILSSAETTYKIRDLTTDLHRRATEALGAHNPTDEIPSDHPLLVLQQAMIMIMAVDQVVSSLMLQRANKSKGFNAYLKPGQSATTKPVLDHLADVLTNSTVRDLILRETNIDQHRLDAFVAALTLQETRLFAQRFFDHTVSTISETPPALGPQKKRPRGRPKKTIEASVDELGESAPEIPRAIVAEVPTAPMLTTPSPPAAPRSSSTSNPVTVDDFLSDF